MPPIRLTVMGDSFAEGRGDSRPDGSPAGWVPRLAEFLGIPSNGYRNLGTHEATTQDVINRQLPVALINKAPLIGVTVGVNDLVSDFDADRFRSNIDNILGCLRGDDTMLFTVTYPDIPAHLPVPDSFRLLLRRRFAEANEWVRTRARRHGALCFDVATAAEWADPARWSADGLHPSPLGHRIFAETVAEHLENATGTVGRQLAAAS